MFPRAIGGAASPTVLTASFATQNPLVIYGEAGGLQTGDLIQAWTFNGGAKVFYLAEGLGGGGTGNCVVSDANDVTATVPSYLALNGGASAETKLAISSGGGGFNAAAVLHFHTAFTFANTSASRRWGIRKMAAVETGANVGSDFQIESFDDAGNHLAYPFKIIRQTGNASFDAGNVSVTVVGKGLLVKEGANAKQGLSAAMVAGTVTVANTSITANSRIMLTRQDGGANPGAVYVSARVVGTSFTIVSTNGGDTGQVAYQIFEPA